MPDILVDTNVIMYAAGRAHPYREPCRLWLQALADDQLDGVIDVEVIQEILHRFAAPSLLAVGHAMASAAFGLFGEPLPFTASHAHAALALLDEFGANGLRPRDAVHAAICREAGIDRILSADRHFDLVGGLTRVDPLSSPDVL